LKVRSAWIAAWTV